MKLVYFLDRFSKNPELSNVMKIRPVAAELFYADRHVPQHCERTYKPAS